MRHAIECGMLQAFVTRAKKQNKTNETTTKTRKPHTRLVYYSEPIFCFGVCPLTLSKKKKKNSLAYKNPLSRIKQCVYVKFERFIFFRIKH